MRARQTKVKDKVRQYLSRDRSRAHRSRAGARGDEHMHTAHTRARHTERCLQRVMGRLATFPDIQNVMTNAAAYVAWGRCNGWKYSGGIGIWCSVGEWFFEASILLQQRDNALVRLGVPWGSVSSTGRTS